MHDGAVLLDCTLRDGGYYNNWDFDRELVAEYLRAMQTSKVDIVELGFRFLVREGFKGACAYTTDAFLRSLDIPSGLRVSVMINGADLCTELGVKGAITQLFAATAAETPIDIVRIACHFHELDAGFEAALLLAERGYQVGVNLMQISDRTHDEVVDFARRASDKPIEALYFADSMGCLTPEGTARIVGWMREGWSGPIGVHAHDNMGVALANTLRAFDEGATWLDSTVTGMGRGPGNTRTEELAIEAESLRDQDADLVPLLTLAQRRFGPMKEQHGWGTNVFYYLSGKYGIHPSYIQTMLSDPRYSEEDVLAVIEQLRGQGGKSFSMDRLDGARNVYAGERSGKWRPADLIAGRELLILGTGPGTARHRDALESYIRHAKPVVLALNTQSAIAPELIDLRAACHPMRLRADCARHASLPQPLVTPHSMLPNDLRAVLKEKSLLDFGIELSADGFEFDDTFCRIPQWLVIAYALGIAGSGRAARILLAGFDGYPPGDPRNEESSRVFESFSAASSIELLAITGTTYRLRERSVYGL